MDLFFPACDLPPSPIQLGNLLASNDAPIQKESDLTLAHISRLESKLAQLEEPLSLLRRKQSDILSSIAAHKKILSPIRRFPPEILSLIFSFAVEATFYFGDISEVVGPMTHLAPWVFTRVCRRWAEVALATPSLWAMVFLDLDRVGERDVLQMVDLLHHRSRNMPLTVKIFSEQAERRSHQVLDAAVVHAERWENVDLYLKLPLLLRLTDIGGHLSALRTLTMSLDIDLEALDADPDIWNIFAIAPRLTALCASFWDDEHLLPSPFVFPWHQLTRLSTTFTTDSEAFSVLQKLSSIVECRLEYSRTEEIAPWPPIRLPYLRSLLIQMDDTTMESPTISRADQGPTLGSPRSLLDILETPLLQSLATHHTADVPAILRLLHRSQCTDTLQVLRIHCMPLHADSVLAIV
ncbi:hypothetical protein FB45DRAFT_841009, partial [Roridomyces roridus]